MRNRRLNKQASEMSERRIKRLHSGERSNGIKSEWTRLLRVHMSITTVAGQCRVEGEISDHLLSLSPSDLHQESDATGQSCSGAAPQGGRGGEGEREGASASAAPLAPFQPPVYQHEKQVLQRAHTSAKWAHMHTRYTRAQRPSYLSHFKWPNHLFCLLRVEI